MDRDAAFAVAFAALAVVTLGVAAATLDTAVEYDGGDGLGASGAGGIGAGGTSDVGDRQPAPALEFDPPEICYPWLRGPPVVGGLMAAFALVFWFAYSDSRSIVVSTLVGGVVLYPVVLVWYILAFCDGRSDTLELVLGFGTATAPENASLFPDGGGTLGVSEAAGTVSAPTLFVGLLLVAAVAASVALLFVAGSDDELPAEPWTEDPDRADSRVEVDELGRLAGEAADRIENDASVDNEVFRAWREMTRHLDVDRPESSTPAEFADAAIDAGMEPEDVNALTDLFEDVRYGGRDPTPEREHRAVEALRRIETAYTESDGGGSV